MPPVGVTILFASILWVISKTLSTANPLLFSIVFNKVNKYLFDLSILKHIFSQYHKYRMTPPIWCISVSEFMFHMGVFWNMIWHVYLGYPLLKHPVKMRSSIDNNVQNKTDRRTKGKGFSKPKQKSLSCGELPVQPFYELL